jgi:2-methylcitrate dehydratase PrpD
MQDTRILALRAKIALVPSEELAHAMPRRQAIVSVKTRDGRNVSKRTVAVRGTADNPMSQAEIEAKALDLIAAFLARAARKRSCARSRASRPSPMSHARAACGGLRHEGRSHDASLIERRCRGGASNARLP